MTYIYAAIAVVGALLGGFLTHLYEGGRVEVLKASQAREEAKWASQQASAQALATAALQKQIADAARISKGNEDVIADLHQKLAAADAARASDRAIASRMFHAAACPAGGGVPQAGGIAGTTAASRAPGIDELAGACADVAAEDARNIAARDALSAQIKPQL